MAEGVRLQTKFSTRSTENSRVDQRTSAYGDIRDPAPALPAKLSALDGKADIPFCTANVRLWPEGDIRRQDRDLSCALTGC